MSHYSETITATLRVAATGQNKPNIQPVILANKPYNSGLMVVSSHKANNQMAMPTTIEKIAATDDRRLVYSPATKGTNNDTKLKAEEELTNS